MTLNLRGLTCQPMKQADLWASAAASRTALLSEALVVSEGLRLVHTGHSCANPPQQSVRHRQALIEVKEHSGGFVLNDARDVNQAIQIAARIPSARTGSVLSRRSATRARHPHQNSG